MRGYDIKAIVYDVMRGKKLAKDRKRLLSLFRVWAPRMPRDAWVPNANASDALAIDVRLATRELAMVCRNLWIEHDWRVIEEVLLQYAHKHNLPVIELRWERAGSLAVSSVVSAEDRMPWDVDHLNPEVSP